MRHSTSRQVGTAVRPDRLPIEERLDLGRLLRAEVELGRPDDSTDLAGPPRPYDGAGDGAVIQHPGNRHPGERPRRRPIARSNATNLRLRDNNGSRKLRL